MVEEAESARRRMPRGASDRRFAEMERIAKQGRSMQDTPMEIDWPSRLAEAEMLARSGVDSRVIRVKIELGRLSAMKPGLALQRQVEAGQMLKKNLTETRGGFAVAVKMMRIGRIVQREERRLFLPRWTQLVLPRRGSLHARTSI